jgi:predicted DNA-binding transcriptional regulator AlpA
MDQFFNTTTSFNTTHLARAKPVKPTFRLGMPLETWVFGADAYSDAPLFGGETLLSPQQVADALGVSTCQLDRMIASGVGPPYFRFGPRLRRFMPSIVRDWAKHRVEIAEIANTENLESFAAHDLQRRPARVNVPVLNGRTKGKSNVTAQPHYHNSKAST